MQNKSGSAGRKFSNGKKIIIGIIAVCILALIAEVVLLITFGKKKKGSQPKVTEEPTAEAAVPTPEEKYKTLWRVASSVMSSYPNGVSYITGTDFEYDELGRETLRTEWYLDEQDQKKPVEKYKNTYYGGGCVIRERLTMKDELIGATFFTEEGLISGETMVVDYKVGSNGHLSELTTVYDTTATDEYYPEKWEFDSEGKITRSTVYDCCDHEKEYFHRTYTYDDKGTLCTITKARTEEEEYNSISVSYQGDQCVVTRREYTGRYTEEVYQGNVCTEIREYDSIPGGPDFLLNEMHLFLPKGNFEIPYNSGPYWTSRWTKTAGSGLYELENLLFCFSATYYQRNGEIKESSNVDVAEDGQPFRMYMGEYLRVEYHYDGNRNVYQRVAYDYNGEIIRDMMFSLDENGNLACLKYVPNGDSTQTEYEWIAIHVPEE